jgi:hypothetical protein
MLYPKIILAVFEAFNFLADFTRIYSQILHRPRLNLRKICAFEICVKSARKLNQWECQTGVQHADRHLF